MADKNHSVLLKLFYKHVYYFNLLNSDLLKLSKSTNKIRDLTGVIMQQLNGSIHIRWACCLLVTHMTLEVLYLRYFLIPNFIPPGGIS
jgi:hypothetical protein